MPAATVYVNPVVPDMVVPSNRFIICIYDHGFVTESAVAKLGTFSAVVVVSTREKFDHFTRIVSVEPAVAVTSNTALRKSSQKKGDEFEFDTPVVVPLNIA